MSDLVRLRLDRLQRVPHLRRDGLLLLTRPHNPHLLARPLALAHHRHGRVDSLLAPKRSVTHSRIAFPLCVVSLDQGVGRCLWLDRGLEFRIIRNGDRFFLSQQSARGEQLERDLS